MPVNQVSELVARVFLLKNRSVDKNVLMFTAAELQQRLKKNYYYLAIEELKTAFENGVFGKYGEFYEISVVTLCNWLDDYINSSEREMYLEQHRPKCKAIAQAATVTCEEIKNAQKHLILSGFKDFCYKRHILYFGEKIYDFMADLKIWVADDKTKKQKYAEAAKIINEEKKSKHGIALRDYLAKMANPEYAKHEQIWIAKRLCVEYFFAQLIAENKVNEFINKLTEK